MQTFTWAKAGSAKGPVRVAALLPGSGYPVEGPVLFWVGEMLGALGWHVQAVKWATDDNLNDDPHDFVTRAAETAFADSPGAEQRLIVAKSLSTLSIPWAEKPRPRASGSRRCSRMSGSAKQSAIQQRTIFLSVAPKTSSGTVAGRQSRARRSSRCRAQTTRCRSGKTGALPRGRKLKFLRRLSASCCDSKNPGEAPPRSFLVHLIHAELHQYLALSSRAGRLSTHPR